MLLLDDDDELPASPSKEERALAVELGTGKLSAIDRALEGATSVQWFKVARIVHEAMRAGGFDPWEERHLHLHVRRVIDLVASGTLEAEGNLRRPRFSEVRRRTTEADPGPNPRPLPSPLAQAAEDGKLVRVRQLVLVGKDVNEADEYGWLPIHRAAGNNRGRVVAYLLTAGSQLEARGTDGWTPLHLACVSGSISAVAVLLDSGADVNAVAKGGNTPLHLALVTVLGREHPKLHRQTVRRAGKMLGLLLAAGANPHARDCQGRSAADVSREKGAASLVSLLERA